MTTLSAPLDRIPADRVHQPGTPGYDAARDGFDLSAVPTPDVAVSVTDEDDVTTAVRFAADRGMPIAVRATGHGPIRGVDLGLLIDTRAISTIAIDPARRTATVGAGATWTQVLTKCAPFGLIPLCGSSPDVGVASYTLGGGLSPLGRRHGWAADRVHRIRLVPADGRLREITRTPNQSCSGPSGAAAATSGSRRSWSSTSFRATPSTAARSTCRARPHPSCSLPSAGARPPRPTSSASRSPSSLSPTSTRSRRRCAAGSSPTCG